MAVHSVYFNRQGTDRPRPGLKSPPSTRPLSALPLVASLLHQGIEGLRTRLRAPLQAIAALAELMGRDPEVELLHAPQTGILCFRLRPRAVPETDLPALQEHVFEQLAASRDLRISLARVQGKLWLRLVAPSPVTTLAALTATLARCKVLAGTFQV
jgi:L-2,4-diaminobutyrate decarboxylase